MKKMFGFIVFLLFFIVGFAQKNTTPASLVNVFLGTSGDHGQLSPAASAPFSMLSILPQTYPSIHTGYEYYAKEFLGFAHTCFEGVGCRGSGGNILVKPFMGENPDSCHLIKVSQDGKPGYYAVSFKNGIDASFAVNEKYGMHQYIFPKGKKGLYFNLSYSLANGFVSEAHHISGDTLSGWFRAGTTCSVGKYKLYYCIILNHSAKWIEKGNHQLVAVLPENISTLNLRIAVSSVNEKYAHAAIGNYSFAGLIRQGFDEWNKALGRIEVPLAAGNASLFYSLLYRTIQSPYRITEPDGHYLATNGAEKISKETLYNGWSIWDNYRTQLPLLSIVFPNRYKGITQSIAELYASGKKDYATDFEPSNTVRTEHAIIVLLDAYRKGYTVDFATIIDSLKKEVDGLDFSHPDKALESSYDTWAFSQILKVLHEDKLSKKYLNKALTYKTYWNKSFKDINKRDVDQMQARGMYQGTVWQYRWFVPFDVKGLITADDGEAVFTKHLDTFFENDFYNHANEPDIQVPLLYNATYEPWKSQYLMHKFALDSVVQYYFNDNSRGIDPYIGMIYKNQPRAYLRTMDDDAGAMSSWFVFAACGFFPACVGSPVYYLNVPLFKNITLQTPNGEGFSIKVQNFGKGNCYIKKIILNGKSIRRNYITQEEIMKGGSITFIASNQPQKNAIDKVWISKAD